jgi:hypothetical protein
MGNTKTTRPKRRVVWTLLGAALAVYASVFLATNWAFSSALAKTAPEGTIATLVINPNRQNYTVIEKALAGWPLISSTNWTWSDIRPLKPREIAIYWRKDGTRAVGVRTSQDFPQKTSQENGIKIQQVGKNLFILSDQTCALTQNKIGYDLILPKLAFWNKTKTLGHIFFFGEVQEEGVVTGNEDKIEISLPIRDLTSLPFTKINEQVIGALSIPVWTKLHMFWIPQNTINNLQPLSKIDLNATFDKIANTPGRVLLAQERGRLTFLIETEETALPWDTSLEIIRLAAALNYPKLETLTLNDLSTTQELRVDPKTVKFVELQVGGQSAIKAMAGPDNYYLTAKNGNTILTGNSQDLLEFYWRPENSNRPIPCDLQNSFIDLKAMQNIITNPLNTYSTHSLSQIADKFSFIGIISGFFSTKIAFCF